MVDLIFPIFKQTIILTRLWFSQDKLVSIDYFLVSIVKKTCHFVHKIQKGTSGETSEGGSFHPIRCIHMTQYT
jgi:hypothetical protein